MPPRNALIVAGLVVALAVIGIAALTRGESGQGPAFDSDAPRPNVLLIVSDDQSLGSFTPEVMPRTFELLVEAGVNFESAINSSPLCCPARASILTGQYGHNNGVLKNEYDDLRKKRNVLPVWLQQAGYETAHVGKFLNGYEQAIDDRGEVAPGWDHWHTALAPRRYYDYELEVNGRRTDRKGTEPEDHLTRVLTRRATDLIRRFSGDERPFYLQLDYYNPHAGGPDLTERCPGGPVPDPLDAELFVDEPLPDTPSIDEADVSDKAPVVAGLDRLTEEELEQARVRWGCTLASMRGLDRGVGELIESLEQTGQLEDTLIMFISDNGYFHGEHRIPAKKHYPYEENLRVPFVVRMPATLAGDRARWGARAEPVASTDIPATIAELTGAEPCAGNGRCRTLDGRSLMPLLGGGGEWPERRHLLIELQLSDRRTLIGGLCGYAGIWDGDAVLIEHERLMPAGGEHCERWDPPFTEVYDLREDPYQLSNAAGRPEGEAIETRFRPLLHRLRDCAGIDGRDERDGERPFCE